MMRHEIFVRQVQVAYLQLNIRIEGHLPELHIGPDAVALNLRVNELCRFFAQFLGTEHRCRPSFVLPMTYSMKRRCQSQHHEGDAMLVDRRSCLGRRTHVHVSIHSADCVLREHSSIDWRSFRTAGCSIEVCSAFCTRLIRCTERFEHLRGF